MKWHQAPDHRFLKAALSFAALRRFVPRSEASSRLQQPHRQRRACAALLSAALLASPAAAQDGAAIAANGVSGARACASCHGAHGEGNADSGFPRLADLDAAYLAHQLASFAAIERVANFSMSSPLSVIAARSGPGAGIAASCACLKPG